MLIFLERSRKSNELTKILKRMEEYHKGKLYKVEYFRHKQRAKVCLSCYMTETPRIRETYYHNIQYIVKYDNLSYDSYKCKATTIISKH
ncbi:hypothetical protein TSAR_011280 [Trichomalopsis sarcophagae]|uniref:Uncharacterized protein n=1 Tax=Trichomalopsis sarcophagae TaxID=543379 RepID=A0A232EJW9_9HYME|nr:hypothetical protein TSAR_011280 [Trichomalopsis sarcophagae]